MAIAVDDRTEWLEADGLGGFASGTTSGIRTRRYHALLLTATTPPTGRFVLVNGFDAWVDTPDGSFALTTQRYAPDVMHPSGRDRIVSFAGDPWPAWTFEGAGARIRQEIFVRHGGATFVTWTLERGDRAVLHVRPFVSGRDYHTLHHENGAFRFEPDAADAIVAFGPYDGVPRIVFGSNGEYHHAPDWYRQFLYRDERERGLDDVEDLASPGEFRWTLTASTVAIWMLKAGAAAPADARSAAEIAAEAAAARDAERQRRSALASRLDRSADAYLVQRRTGRTIIAGYPWFTDWGRDTFISLRGLCLATGRFDDARDILLEWADTVSEGMVPNRFPDRGGAPEFNAVDASLWFVIAVDGLLRSAGACVGAESRAALESAVDAIVSGYAAGTRFAIRMDGDGLLAAGVPGVALTWMDARVGDRVVTPRIGKPVEVQALWLNALAIAAARDPRWREALERGLAAFADRFWIDERGHLADVVDVDHAAGTRDETFRPNQILAVGGLPLQLVDAARARRIVDAVEARLVTPLGLRTLAPDEPGYTPRYEGGPSRRDGIYHQGAAWPWLIGPFVEAWVRVRGGTAAARREARRRFVEPLLAHVDAAGIGHVSEIVDGEPPFTPRGCPFQAWSLGELLRLDRVALAKPPPARPRPKGARRRNSYLA